MSVVNVRISEEDKDLFSKYAQFNNMTLSELFRTAVMEKIEDEYDLEVVRDYEERKERGEVEYITHEELLRELDL